MGKLPSYLLWTVLQGAEKENNCRCLKLQKNKIFKAKPQENKPNAANAKHLFLAVAMCILKHHVSSSVCNH